MKQQLTEEQKKAREEAIRLEAERRVAVRAQQAAQQAARVFQTRPAQLSNASSDSQILNRKDNPQVIVVPVKPLIETQPATIHVARETDDLLRKRREAENKNRRAQVQERQHQLAQYQRLHRATYQQDSSSKVANLGKDFRNLALSTYYQFIPKSEQEKKEKSAEASDHREDLVRNQLIKTRQPLKPTDYGPVSFYYHVEHSLALYIGLTRQLLLKTLEIRDEEGSNLSQTANVAAVRLNFKSALPIIEGAASEGLASGRHSERIALCRAINRAIYEIGLASKVLEK